MQRVDADPLRSEIYNLWPEKILMRERRQKNILWSKQCYLSPSDAHPYTSTPSSPSIWLFACQYTAWGISHAPIQRPSECVGRRRYAIIAQRAVLVPVHRLNVVDFAFRRLAHALLSFGSLLLSWRTEWCARSTGSHTCIHIVVWLAAQGGCENVHKSSLAVYVKCVFQSNDGTTEFPFKSSFSEYLLNSKMSCCAQSSMKFHSIYGLSASNVKRPTMHKLILLRSAMLVRWLVLLPQRRCRYSEYKAGSTQRLPHIMPTNYEIIIFLCSIRRRYAISEQRATCRMPRTVHSHLHH